MMRSLWVLQLACCICTIILLTDAKSLDRVRRETLDQTSESCPIDHYKCDGGKKCILLKSICDGYYDCQDKRDERNCISTNQTTTSTSGTYSTFDDKLNQPTCHIGKFTCDKGVKCLPLTWLCDSIDDCVDKQDEHNCQNKKQGIAIAKAAEEAAINAAQQAKRAALAAEELMINAKEEAIKARKAMKILQTHLA